MNLLEEGGLTKKEEPKGKRDCKYSLDNPDYKKALVEAYTIGPVSQNRTRPVYFLH